MKKSPFPSIVVDNREQAPYLFQGPHFPGVEVKRGTLQTGDYSLEGFESQVAVERKGQGLGDLIACLMGPNRDRFEKELGRGLKLRAFMVVVEATWEDVCRGWYTSKMRPKSACMSILAFEQRYRVTFHFAGTRTAAEYCVYGFLKQFFDDREEERKAREKESKGGEK